MHKFHRPNLTFILVVVAMVIGFAIFLAMKHPAKASTGVPVSSYTHSTKNNAYVLKRPIVHVSGTLSANATWNSQHVYVIDSQLTISSGVTLTINHGTIVKYVSTSQDAITVSSGSILNVYGTSTDPVIFTSYKDDSAGGDTNGDGNASSPAPGDYGAAITISGSLSNVKVKVSYADFRYGTQSLSLYCVSDSNVSATITDSTIEDQVYVYACEAGQGKLTLQRNHFTLAANDPNTAITLYYSDPSGIILAGANQNTFTGSGKQITVFASSSGGPDLAHGSIWTLASTSGAVLDVDDIGIAGSLSIGAGVIVKIEQSANGFLLDSGGTLKVNGTSSAPVIFTSYKDDSVGGDTNGDGPSTGAPGDYGAAIVANNNSGAILNVSFAAFRYGTQSLALNCVSSKNISATITDSTIEEQVSAYACEAGQGKLYLQRDHFALAANDPNTAVELYYSDPSGIVLAGAMRILSQEVVRRLQSSSQAMEISITIFPPAQPGRLLGPAARWLKHSS